jgi:hypothetical protein
MRDPERNGCSSLFGEGQELRRELALVELQSKVTVTTRRLRTLNSP